MTSPQPQRKRIFISGIIIAFWIFMLSSLVWREFFAYLSSTHQTGYEQTLKPLKEARSDRMLIYYGSSQVKELGYIESITMPQPDGTYELSTRVKLEADEASGVNMKQLSKMLGLPELEENKAVVGLKSRALVGPDFQLKDLFFQLKSNIFDLQCEGEMKPGRFVLSLEQNGEQQKREVPVPSGTMFMNSFEPVSVPKNLKVGEEFRMRWFDALTQKYREVSSKVLSKDKLFWNKEERSVHVVRTDFGLLSSNSWVDKEGRVLKHQVLNFTFIRDPKEDEATKAKTPVKKNKEGQ